MPSTRVVRSRPVRRLHPLDGALVVVAAMASAPPGVAAQEPITLRGQVRVLETGRPLPDVRVAIVGTSLAVTTDRQGAFEFRDLSPGDLMLRFDHTEHATLIERVEIGSRDLQLAFSLPTPAFVLDELAVVGALGSDREAPAASSLGNVLDGVAGVQLVRTGGAVGQGYYLRIRGVNSFSFSATPAIFLDGVRVSFGGEAGGSNVLDLISASDVGRIEVLRGSAAPAQYGPDAVNGLILVTTKRGQP